MDEGIEERAIPGNPQLWYYSGRIKVMLEWLTAAGDSPHEVVSSMEAILKVPHWGILPAAANNQ